MRYAARVGAILLALGPGAIGLGGQASKGAFIADPSLTSSTGSSALALNLEVTTEQKRILAKFGVQVGDADLDVKLSAPLEEARGTVELADFDGLRTATSLDVGFQWFGWNPVSNPEAARNLCNELAEERTAAGLPGPTCITVTRKTFPSGAWRTRYDRTYSIGVAPILFGRLKLGNQRFRHVDSVSLAARSETKQPASLVAGLGVFAGRAGLFHASVQWEHAYQGAPAEDLCVPLGTTGALRCRQTALAGPTEHERVVLRGEWRAFVTATVGIGWRVNYDVDARRVGVELPAFLHTAADGGFNTGVVLGWIPEDRTLVLGAFVGPAGLAPAL